MKNKVSILIIFLSFVQTSNAQSNFGKRKFSRSLFSKNIHWSSSKEERTSTKCKKTKAVELEISKDTQEETESTELMETLPIEPNDIAEVENDTTALGDLDLEIVEMEEAEKLDIVEKTEVISKPSFASSFSSKKVNQTFNLESKAFYMSANVKQKFNNQHTRDRLFDFDWDEILGWLFAAALCVGYLLLLHYFPVITAIATIIAALVLVIVLIKGFFNLLGDIFSGIFG